MVFFIMLSEQLNELKHCVIVLVSMHVWNYHIYAGPSMCLLVSIVLLYSIVLCFLFSLLPVILSTGRLLAGQSSIWLLVCLGSVVKMLSLIS